jgi:zinc/manganese transport system substrate-binding protein
MRALLAFFLLAAGLVHAAPTVVTTTTILDDLVRTVGGEHVAASCLLQRGVDPHGYEPTPADVRRLARADLLVVNGLGFETWLDKLIKNSGFRGTLVVASEGVDALHADEEHEGHDHAHAHESHVDPHAWHDPKRARRYVENIAAALALANAPHAADYEKNAAALRTQLSSLDEYARAQFGALPAERRKLVTSHDSLRYLGNAYGLALIPISGLSPEREPSARELAKLVRLIRKEKVPAVFIESTSNPKIPELLAREAGVAVVTGLYTDSLGALGSPGATYLEMFRANVDTIVRALR